MMYESSLMPLMVHDKQLTYLPLWYEALEN